MIPYKLMWSRVKFIAVFVLALVLFSISIFDDWLKLEYAIEECEVLQRTVVTASGLSSYPKLLESVYSPRGYSICPQARCNTSFVELYKSIQCDAIFKHSFDSSSRKKQRKHIFPDEFKSDYMLDDTVRMFRYHYNESRDEGLSSSEVYVWTTDNILTYSKKRKAGDWKAFPYKQDTKSLNDALRKFPVQGRGLVIGSIKPWVEAMALDAGAESLVTVDYHPIQSQDSRLSYVAPQNLTAETKQFDFAITFSSLEHSGLGRYGDTFNPEADLLEMRKLSCLVKPGGLVYVAVPTGRDALFWDAHRVYGSVRWPLLIANWRLLKLFHRFGSGFPPKVTPEQLFFALEGKHMVAVLENSPCNTR